MKNKMNNVEASSIDVPVIGSFEGMCADAEITNENGLDITREVWETVFASELYKQGIDLGWYIGYLGHPEDPNCMEFEHACVVMTEGHIDDDGKVYGKFNLIDTPVGRIVKTFIDAGVTFGISVRGAGDIINNSVDPETFVFRGFDLVTFPAYKEAIPEFKEIAASSNLEDQQKYKKVCAAVNSELKNIDSSEALEVIQEQLPEQSEIYREVGDRIGELSPNDEEIVEKTLEEEKIDSLTSLYLEERKRAEAAELSVAEASRISEKQAIKMNKKLHTMARIVASQERDLDAIDGEMKDEYNKLANKHRTVVKSNRQLKKHLDDEKETNLQYCTKIEASDKLLSKKDSTIRSLQEELDKTVVEAQTATKRASNLDDKVKSLEKRIVASQQMIEEYQDAYASLYARVLGVDLGQISVTASTSVDELQNKITGSAHYTDPDELEEPQLVELDDDEDDSLITI